MLAPRPRSSIPTHSNLSTLLFSGVVHCTAHLQLRYRFVSTRHAVVTAGQKHNVTCQQGSPRHFIRSKSGLNISLASHPSGTTTVQDWQGGSRHTPALQWPRTPPPLWPRWELLLGNLDRATMTCCSLTSVSCPYHLRGSVSRPLKNPSKTSTEEQHVACTDNRRLDKKKKKKYPHPHHHYSY